MSERDWIAPDTHLDNIYAKLGVHSRAAATARLLQTGDGPAETVR